MLYMNYWKSSSTFWISWEKNRTWNPSLLIREERDQQNDSSCCYVHYRIWPQWAWDLTLNWLHHPWTPALSLQYQVESSLAIPYKILVTSHLQNLMKRNRLKRVRLHSDWRLDFFIVKLQYKRVTFLCMAFCFEHELLFRFTWSRPEFECLCVGVFGWIQTDVTHGNIWHESVVPCSDAFHC